MGKQSKSCESSKGQPVECKELWQWLKKMMHMEKVSVIQYIVMYS